MENFIIFINWIVICLLFVGVDRGLEQILENRKNGVDTPRRCHLVIGIFLMLSGSIFVYTVKTF